MRLLLASLMIASLMTLPVNARNGRFDRDGFRNDNTIVNNFYGPRRGGFRGPRSGFRGPRNFNRGAFNRGGFYGHRRGFSRSTVVYNNYGFGGGFGYPTCYRPIGFGAPATFISLRF